MPAVVSTVTTAPNSEQIVSSVASTAPGPKFPMRPSMTRSQTIPVTGRAASPGDSSIGYPGTRLAVPATGGPATAGSNGASPRSTPRATASV